MEVHHHAHTSRKKWTHYFWEFLMLFLAVFCGFLAEYTLEHKIENDREKQYMQSLVEDLKRDTAEYQRNYTLAKRQLLLLDSLLDLVNNQPISGDNINRLYMLATNSTRVLGMRFEKRTSSQLKNAGGMRLVRKREVADSILSYWSYIEVSENIRDRLESIGTERSNVAARLFHNKYYIREVTTSVAPATGIKDGATLINSDPALMAEYSNRTYSRIVVTNNYVNLSSFMKEQAIRLMDQVRKEYKVK